MLIVRGLSCCVGLNINELLDRVVGGWRRENILEATELKYKVRGLKREHPG